MNKQKINDYLSESLQPWHPSSLVAERLDISMLATHITLAVYTNEYIKFLIEDKTWTLQNLK